MKSVLSKATSADVCVEPMPHIILRDAIDDATCLRLIEEFPSIDTVTEGKSYTSNERFSLSAVRIPQNTGVSATWQEFIAAHVSQSFFDEFISVFGDHIKAIYPQLEERFGPLKGWRAGMRKRDKFPEVQTLLDAQICINTPVLSSASSVRRGHVDIPDKLFAGLFYLRHPKDDSVGGDLEIQRYKQGGPANFKGQFIADEFVETIKTVKYERNVLVLFLNTPHALHAVTDRLPTKMPRYFMNLVCEVPQPVFDLKPMQMETDKWVREINQYLGQFAEGAQAAPDAYSATSELQTLEVLTRAVCSRLEQNRSDRSWSFVPGAIRNLLGSSK